MKKEMHRLLKRQVSKFLSEEQLSKLPQEFLEAINNAYLESDRDRLLTERALELTSAESIERFKKLRLEYQESEQIKDKLTQSNEILRITMDASFDAIAHLDEKGKPLSFNMTSCRLMGLTPKGFKALDYQKLGEIIHLKVKNPEILLKKLRRPIKEHTQSGLILLELHDGRFFECHARVLSKSGDYKGLVWTVRNITELKLKEKEAQHRAYHDDLTSLPNRRLFIKQLEHAVSLSKRSGFGIAVFFMDLDNFKYVNDSLGHHIGDQLLKDVSIKIQDILRSCDTCARLGGDEFLILLENVKDQQEIINVLQRIQSVFNQPFILKNKALHLSSSIGVATLESTDYDENFSSQSLITQADMAMYSAKKSGKNTYRFYTPELSDFSNRRLNIHNALKQALKRSEFFLQYQPKFDVKTKQITGVEALIRWSKNGKELGPNEFIQAAEQNGMIMPISLWVLEQACSDMASWEINNHQDFTVAINVSAIHFQRGDLIDDIQNCLTKYQINPANFEIEITESSFIKDIDGAVEKLEKLKALGIKIALDDFGTGYSSFTYLSRLPVSSLKIDRSFIALLGYSDQQYSLVVTLIQIAHIFNLSVIAEGVEDQVAVKLLEKANCDQLQGFWFSEALSAQNIFERYLQPSTPPILRLIQD